MSQAGANSRSIWPVLDDPYFQLALTFAKGAARHAGVQNLSALLLVVGLQLARGSAKSELPRSVADRWEDIERAAARLGLAAGERIKPLKQATFPLDQSLKRILRSAGASLETLVPALLDAVSSPEAADDKAFNTTLAYATAIAGQYGLSEISPETFAAAAFAAWRDGRFRDRPAAAAHIAANKNCFEALITEKSWVIGGPAAFDAAFQKQLRSDSRSHIYRGDKFVAVRALNSGFNFLPKRKELLIRWAPVPCYTGKYREIRHFRF